MNRTQYNSPLNTRYSSKEMSAIFSETEKFKTYRRLWTELARAEMELGLNITDAQVQDLADHIEDIDFERAAAYEKELRHDVMAHVKTYGEAAPSAKGIIHLGATSCFVTDNTDIIIMGRALQLVRKKLAVLIDNLCRFANTYKAMPTLGFTHYQPAQLVTVGKRATLWMQDFLFDLEDLNYRLEHLKLRGVKGTTGTQASYLDLFNGDDDKVRRLEDKVVRAMGFTDAVKVSGQTYTRKIDAQVMSVLQGIAVSAHKMTNDIRLLQNLKELEEPFEKNQIGSSAMAYKRNPMRSERIASLSKYIIALSESPSLVAMTQWLERTLDDSANKRLSIAECFLGVDAVLEIAINVTDGMVVNEKVVAKHVAEELPFMATENILMEAVKRGGNRQELHEVIRENAMKAAARVKQEGLDNNLLELLVADPRIDFTEDMVTTVLNPQAFIGRCPAQVDEVIAFAKELIAPYLSDYHVELNV
ncbi:adenylosuccinate lyase [Peptoniphilus equinus]|uniref:Adenylosuccinate lyase n=1 Tax=Peptoniphilus equinus TaxID=3016343 RepID=A0ABY7QTD1_9FIRM|nr:adenylosuccinate lyase [Peptoniphilus equinus]WBW49721.1 adenylosuccinate lyase [Peptoniphilus equinus]